MVIDPLQNNGSHCFESDHLGKPHAKERDGSHDTRKNTGRAVAQLVNRQLISFIDPKGLMHIHSDDPKIDFHKTIKELEARMAPTAGDKKLY